MVRSRRISPQTAAVVLALADQGTEWSHGYDLCTRLGLKAGTVYPILMRLSDRDLVETTWEQRPPRGRPPRHLYRLTPEGARLAAQVRSAPEPAPMRTVPPRPALGGAAS